MESYYTKLKTIWQDLCDYRPIHECTCGGVKLFIEHMDFEFVMIFLMGLSDSYATVRAQILLMKPIPSITSVFSLIIQEEHQRSIGISSISNIVSSPDNVALLAAEASKKQGNDRFWRKENQRPICSHCNIKGHTIDKCYKLHGYPLSYKFRNSNNSTNEASGPKAVDANVVAQPQGNFFSSLNTTNTLN